MKHEDLGPMSPASQDRIKCNACSTFVENCDGDECDYCGQFTCYECGTHIEKDWVCPSCAEARQLEDEGEDDDSGPDYLELMTGISAKQSRDIMEKHAIKREAAERDRDEARGK